MKQKSNILGKTGIEVSTLGFGAYRVDNNSSENRKALIKSILAGVNLIDTSSNYSDGGSEELVGDIINSFIDEKRLEREDFVVVTKGGYIQGPILKMADKRVEEGNPYPEVVRCTPGMLHSIHPEFLADQIEVSLQRLNLESIDVYLLHNPEYFLLYSVELDLEKLREEYYRRIKEAFKFLETQVEAGKIKYYGISSNTFGESSDKRGFTSLEKIIKIAEEVSDKNHFAVVQAPLNVMEKGAANKPNQFADTKTFLEAAEENNLGVITNRPLNALDDGRLFRLADFDVTEEVSDEEIAELFKKQNDLESEIINQYKDLIPAHQKNNFTEYLSLSAFLKTNLKKFSGITHFNQIKNRQLIPQLNYVLKEIHALDPDNQETINQLNQLAVTANILLNSLGSVMSAKKNEMNKAVHELLNKTVGKEFEDFTLSQKSILIVKSHPSVNSVLVGMRSEKYVDDTIKVLKITEEEKVSKFWKSN